MKIRELFIFGFLIFCLFQVVIDIKGQSFEARYKFVQKGRIEGNFEQAKLHLKELLLMQDSLPSKYKVAVYNVSGLINKDLGKYEIALTDFKKAELICLTEDVDEGLFLPLIYNNMAIIYKINNDYEKALDYYQIALDFLTKSDLPFKERIYEVSKIYHNIGIVYRHLNKFEKAIQDLEQSKKIRERYLLKGLEKVYANLARTYEKMDAFELAEKYYLKSIHEWNKEVMRKNRHRSAGVYNDYALFLYKTERKKDAFYYLNKGHEIYLDSYGERHPFTANSYQTIGDFYRKEGNLQKSLLFYQHSIISNTKTFSNKDVFSLPPLKEVIADIQFLQSLKRKSETLFLFSQESTKKNEIVKYLRGCTQSVNLALGLVKEIRRGYLTKSSKLNITKDEKELYSLATEASLKQYELTKNEDYLEQAYVYSQKSKASLLREEIVQNKAFTSVLPDSIRELKQEIENDIYSYKKLIFDENQEKKPNKEKINNWSHSLFNLNKKYEVLMTEINEKYAAYKRLTNKTDIISLESLQSQLKGNETIVEYSLPPENEGNKKKLFVFIITKNELSYYKNELDTSFNTAIISVTSQMNKTGGLTANLDEYNELNKQFNKLYLVLIQPIEKYFKGSSIFIIPDEEIAYLSFDAFQKSFTNQSSINYASIPYLVYDYCFSYAYSSSLLFQQIPGNYKNNFVYAFAPDYNGKGISSSRLQFGKLENTEKEINSIMKWFNGKALIGREANEDFFKTISSQGGIFHFAMHASAEMENPDFSFLAITQEDENEEDGLFYNYEISMMNMKASMVVLSGCNTGYGVISSGEGVMNLTRNFILAGVPSIVHSLWEVEDETSVIIMDKFYEYLSKGFPKNEALWYAKTDYMENVTPSLVNPYYWSGYIHSGNPEPIVEKYKLPGIILPSSIVVILFLIILYLRKKGLRNKSL